MFCLSMAQKSFPPLRCVKYLKNLPLYSENSLTDFLRGVIMLRIKLDIMDVLSPGVDTMEQKELKKLKRVQLLELLLEQTRRAEQLEQALAVAKQQLQSRQVQVSEAGNLAEAALRLNDVFSSAQNAADQYLQNVRSRDVVLDEARQEAARIIKEAQQQAERTTRETEAACTAMREKAQKDTQRYWDALTQKLSGYMDQHPELKRQLLRESAAHRL